MCVNFFSVKNFSGTAIPRILKFGTKLGNDKLYCVIKNQPHVANQSLYLSIFSSPEPSGSQGELIVYPWSVVRQHLSSSVHIFSSPEPKAHR